MGNQTDIRVDWNQLSEEAREDRRKGKRVTLQFIVEISGKDKSEAGFHVRGRTRNVSHDGCCVELGHEVIRGDMLELKVIRRNERGRIEATDPLPFRAAWVVREGQLWVVGAEMVAAQGPWGMGFPPKVPRLHQD